MTLILYDLVGSSDDVRFSPHCWKTRMSLAHKGLEYQTVPTTFVGVPQVENGVSRTIPVIRDGERIIADSFAIALYLDEAYPDRPSLFDGDGGRSMGRFIERWSQLTLHPYIGVATLMEEVGLLEPASAAYFRKSRGKKPKLSDRQHKELRRMYDTGDYSISDLAELFSVSRPTVYRTLARGSADKSSGAVAP